MNENSILRFSFIVGSGQASSFNTNLYKLICAVLFYDNVDVNCMQISERINEEYGLFFTEEEIHKIVKSNKFKNDFVFLNNGCLTLSAKKNNQLKETQSKFDLKRLIKQYLKEKNINIDEGYLLELLKEFLYKTFSLNKQVILDLLNLSIDNVIEQLELDNQKKHIINDFLNWENQDKDIFVFNTISYCVDYCQLTIKKDSNTFNNIFKGKTFYLDSNVIFRLIGFNNNERKKVMKAFVNRCEESGITLSYTNFTYQEVRSTIRNYVEGISKYNNGRQPLDYKHYKFYMSGERNLDFIKLYTDWSKKPENSYSDYKKFEDYLICLVNDVLKGFKRADIVSFKVSQKETYNKYYCELSEYKKNHSRPYTRQSIDCDVNNFMYIVHERKSEKGKSAFNINKYLISTDSRLCNWSAEVIPGSVPVCVLPSVWYSLILKYRGRTDDDYRAFSLFLNMRYKLEIDPISEQKEKILAVVQSLEETVVIKNQILDNIYKDIIDSNIIEIEDAEEIVENEHSKIIGEKIAEVEKKHKKNLSEVQIKTVYRFAEKDVEKFEYLVKLLQRVSNLILIIAGALVIIFVGNFILNKGIKSFLEVFSDEKTGLDISHYITFFSAGYTFVKFVIINPSIKLINRQTREEKIEKRFKKLVKKYGE